MNGTRSRVNPRLPVSGVENFVQFADRKVRDIAGTTITELSKSFWRTIHHYAHNAFGNICWQYGTGSYLERLEPQNARVGRGVSEWEQTI